jgi:two-component system, NarL family, response regulator LiaR
MNQEPIRVIIVDDHAMVRSGLRLFLMAFEDLKMIGEATNGEEAIRLCARERPDVVLMDMLMPVMDGIQATREIRLHFPNTQVIGLTSFSESELIQDMLDAGAIGFLMKNVSAVELAQAIHNAYERKPAISDSIHEVLQTKRPASKHTGRSTEYNLSRREREVLVCMVAGRSNAEIAQELSITLSTAKYHVSSVLTKLDVSNRAEAVSLALQKRLIETPTSSKKSK